MTVEQTAKSTVAQIADLTDLCRSFPSFAGVQIPRDNVLQLIEGMFEDGIELSTIEGPEGMGKTTLAAQFAKRHPHRCFSIFVRSASRFAYDPSVVLSDVSDQIAWFLHGRSLANERVGDPAIYNQLVTELQKRARTRRDRFYFVVDGLDDLPREAPEAQSIIDLLPFGLPQFQFVISGNVDRLLGPQKRNVTRRPVSLPGFTLDESIKFLSATPVQADSMHELYKASKGVPAHLASIKRVLETGVDPQTLVEKLPITLPSLFVIEWRAVDETNALLLEILALISHDRRKHTISSLAQFFNAQPADIRTLVSPLTFIKTPVVGTEDVEFVSESFRQFAASKLQYLKERVRTKVIDSLLEHPESEIALAFLPTYLEEAGRLDDLLEFLSPEHFAAMIASSESLTPVQQKAALGVSTAGRLHRDGDMLRFGLESSVIAEMDDYEISRSEVRARMALNDYKSAMALAQGAVLKQDRLRLLAVIARLQAEAGLSPEPEILEQVSQLFKEVDAASLKEKALDLASDLMYSKPELAIQLVEHPEALKVAGQGPDWALASLSGIAAAGRQAGKSGLSVTAEDIRLRIKDPDAFKLSTAVLLLVGNYSSAEVLREVNKLASPIDQLFLLRLWAENAPEPDNAGAIIEHALKLAVRTSEYTPIATGLRQLATPLPSVQETSQARLLVGMFDTQKSTVEKLGPTEDYVRLQLLLTQAEAKYDSGSATTRLLETYYYIGDLKDLEVRTTCTARLVAALQDIDPAFALSDSRDVLAASERELTDGVRDLLGSTADHYLATRHVIEALAKNKPGLALHVAGSLNTEPRRDLALRDMIRVILKARLKVLPLDFLNQCLDKFADPELRDAALGETLRHLAELFDADAYSLLPQVVPFVGRAVRVSDSFLQCNACCHALKILCDIGTKSHEPLASDVRQWLRAAFERLETDYRKIDTGFRIASTIAPYSRDLASEYLEIADRLRTTMRLASRDHSYVGCIRLSIRAFSDLLPKHFDTAEDLDRLSTQIERVASDHTRAYLWTDLILQFARAERIAEAKATLSSHLRPLLENIRNRDEDQWQDAVTTASPALYQAHRASAMELIAGLPSFKREKAYRYIIRFILHRLWQWEPYDGGDPHYQLAYEEALDVIEVLERVQEDSVIYSGVRDVVFSALWKQNRTPFTQQQKADLGQRLANLVNQKLPTPRFIAHDGYKIVSLAQIARLTRQKPEQFEQAISDARKIPNIADRVFVIMEIASSDSNADFLRRVELVKEAKTLADQIPSALDRVERYQLIADRARDIDQSISRQCIKEAFGILPESEDDEIRDLRRGLVDFAHEIDPEWASSLAASLDDDSARKEARKRIALQECKAKMASGASDISAKDVDPAEIPRAAWSLLGKLNAGRIEPLPVSDTRRFVSQASERPMSDAFPMLSWVIQNAIARRSLADEAKRLLRSIYEATLVSSELSFRLSGRMSDRIQKLVVRDPRPPEGKGLVVRSGERTRAMDFLADWLANDTSEYLKICDPYFGPDDLEVLQLILRSAPHLRLGILTSRKQQQQQGVRDPVEEYYREKWKTICDQKPPETDIVIVGNAKGDLPIHDRWWLTKGKGLRIGTSFGSLGTKKESEISVLSETEAQELEATVDEFLETRKREYNGERLSVFLFSL